MKKFNRILILLFALIITISCGLFGCDLSAILGGLKDDGKDKGNEQINGELSFHFMFLGNDAAGDCTYIKAGDNDILIDGGSNYDSIDEISNYVNRFCSDGVLEYVIVTHGDLDHIACWAGKENEDSLFDMYEVGTIIDFPRTNKTSKVYQRYVSERQAEVDDGNTNHYTALDCYNNVNGAKREYSLSTDGSIKMEVLYNYYYEHKATKENDYSVCVMFYHGTRQFLFTGDLEEKGEDKLIEKYNFTQVELFKLGHHGSPTSSNPQLLSKIEPKICVAPACAGSVEYTSNLDNTFPSQEVITDVAKYTDQIFCPSTVKIVQDGVDEDGNPKYKNTGEPILLNGDIKVISKSGTPVYVDCSNNNVILKETEWFKQYRNWIS